MPDRKKRESVFIAVIMKHAGQRVQAAAAASHVQFQHRQEANCRLLEQVFVLDSGVES